MAKIVLVDDDRIVRTTTALLLRTSGHTVYDYEEPSWALYQFPELRQEPRRGQSTCRNVDVVISDINMDGMQGYEFLSRLREIDSHAVHLGTSGHASTYARQAMRAAGAKLIIPKPYDLDALCELVHTCENNREAIVGGQYDISQYEDRLQLKHHSLIR